jgi:hypothetical protein
MLIIILMKKMRRGWICFNCQCFYTFSMQLDLIFFFCLVNVLIMNLILYSLCVCSLFSRYLFSHSFVFYGHYIVDLFVFVTHSRGN